MPRFFLFKKKNINGEDVEPEDLEENLLRGRGLGVFLCDEGGRWKEGGGDPKYFDTFGYLCCRE